MTTTQQLMYSKASDLTRLDFYTHWAQLIRQGHTVRSAYDTAETEYIELKGQRMFADYATFQRKIRQYVLQAKIDLPLMADIYPGMVIAFPAYTKSRGQRELKPTMKYYVMPRKYMIDTMYNSVCQRNNIG